MDKYAPKWRLGAEQEAFEAMRSWLVEARERLAKLVRQRARSLGWNEE
jgi:hypothetical protein